MNHKLCFFTVVFGAFLLSFSLYQRLLEFPILGNVCRINSAQENLEDAKESKPEVVVMDFLKDYVRFMERSPAKPKSNETELQVKAIMWKIDQLVPKVNFTHLDNTTCVGRSRVTIVNPRGRYCVGDTVMVRLDMHDYLGNRKKYGGDLLRARIYSPDLGAGASGAITDFHNGTYHVQFTLFWEGNVKMQLLLIHPSELVAALWRGRNTGYDYVIHKAKYTSPTQNVETKCGYDLDTNEEVCDYMEKKDEYPFYCIKPANMSCHSLTHVSTFLTQNTYLSALERPLFDSSWHRAEIPHGVQFQVLKCTNDSSPVKEKCKTGMKLQFPGGYFLRNVWHPIYCSMNRFSSQDDINGCLKGKHLYLIGDSTMIQWMAFISNKVKTLKEMDLYDRGWQRSVLKVDPDRNIRIKFQKHGDPFVAFPFYPVLENPTIPEQMDRVGGNKHTAIVFTAGIHFRNYPLHIFIRRVINIRKAIQRLLLRSPETKVILKTENTGEKNGHFEKNNDFHGYVQYLIMNALLHDLNVGIVDTWDMTTALDTNMFHPPPDVIENEINLVLTFL